MRRQCELWEDSLMANLFTTVSHWVDYIQTVHLREIDLSLERVGQVYQRLYPQGVDFTVIGVAGTNGKGSTAEILSSIYRQGGYAVGKYTSPHMLDFNERINIDGKDVSDRTLIGAFERVEQSRAEIKLTFFEYGTLVAIDLFMRANLDIVIMEVGLGGRLDASNILDADVAIVTSVSIDHTAWLGPDINTIAAEKIAIAKRGRACVLGMPELTPSIINYCSNNAVQALVYSRDFHATLNESDLTWNWQTQECDYQSLPLPFGQSGHQISNAAVALQVIQLLQSKLEIDDLQIRSGLKNARILGRCQMLSTQPDIILDVAHNADSVGSLLGFLQSHRTKGRVFAVCGMLQDKEIGNTLAQMRNCVDEWHFASIDSARGASATEVEQRLKNQLKSLNKSVSLKSYQYRSAVQAYQTVCDRLKKNDSLVVFGSFFIVSDIIRHLKNSSTIDI